MAWAGALLSVITVSAFALSVVNAFSSGTEDYRGAVAYAVEQWSLPGEAGVISIEPGPDIFPTSIGWRYYAPESGGPELIETTDDYLLRDPGEIAGLDRVIVLARSLRIRFPTLELMRETFREERSERFGYNLVVHVFSNRRDRRR